MLRVQVPSDALGFNSVIATRLRVNMRMLVVSYTLRCGSLPSLLLSHLLLGRLMVWPLSYTQVQLGFDSLLSNGR